MRNKIFADAVEQKIQTREVLDLTEIAKELRNIMQCNCNFDRWEPEQATGHSWVCRVHKAAVDRNAAHFRKTGTYLGRIVVVPKV